MFFNFNTNASKIEKVLSVARKDATNSFLPIIWFFWHRKTVISLKNKKNIAQLVPKDSLNNHM